MKYLTPREFAALPQIRLSPSTVRDACAAGKIPGAHRTYRGGPWRIPADAVPGPRPVGRTRKDLERIQAETLELLGARS